MQRRTLGAETPKNAPDFKAGNIDETIEGKDIRPVAEGSSDASRMPEALDPLRDAELFAPDTEDGEMDSVAELGHTEDPG